MECSSTVRAPEYMVRVSLVAALILAITIAVYSLENWGRLDPPEYCSPPTSTSLFSQTATPDTVTYLCSENHLLTRG